MNEKILNPNQVKPHFSKVKKVWSELIEKYYDNNGNLHDDFIVEVPCPHCGSDSREQTFNLNGFYHHTCFSCQSVYVSPRLKNEILDQIYSDKYYSEMFTRSMIPYFEKRKELIGKSKYRQVLDNINTSMSTNERSVLDIGAGIGEVIDVFKDNGWLCEAIDVNPVSVDWLRSRSIHVFNGPFELFNNDKKFDVIMAWGVIEHVVEPKQFLKKVYSILKPGGLFVSEVPHGNSMLVDYCRNTGTDPLRILQGEQHIMLYSVHAYKQLHMETGFKEVDIKTNGLDLSTIFEIEKQRVDSKLTSQIQTLIDINMYGDLLRGFWVKE